MLPSNQRKHLTYSHETRQLSEDQTVFYLERVDLLYRWLWHRSHSIIVYGRLPPRLVAIRLRAFPKCLWFEKQTARGGTMTYKSLSDWRQNVANINIHEFGSTDRMRHDQVVALPRKGHTTSRASVVSLAKGLLPQVSWKTSVKENRCNQRAKVKGCASYGTHSKLPWRAGGCHQ